MEGVSGVLSQIPIMFQIGTRDRATSLCPTLSQLSSISIVHHGRL